MNPQWIVGVDLGGTNLRGALLTEDLAIRHRGKEPTRRHEGAESVVARLVAHVQDLCGRENLSPSNLIGVGIATPGPLDVAREIVTSAPNFPDWKDFPLKHLVEKNLGAAVLLENDANAAALGEFHRGAGRGAGSLIFLGLGTGVGGGVVLDGRIVRGTHGVGSELGHIIISSDGPPCGCGNRGCLEQLASATAIVRMAKESIAAGASSTLSAPGDFGAREVFKAARRGDRVALDVIDRMSCWLGLGIVSLIHTIDPDVIVIGGGVSESSDLFLDRVREVVNEGVFPAARGKVKIVPAELGDDAGVIGVASEIKAECA